MQKRRLLPVPRLALSWKRRRSTATRKEPALPPGTLVHVGERKTEAFHLSLVAYDRDQVEEVEVTTITEDLREKRTGGPKWIHATGLHDVEQIGKLTALFDIHPLVAEDILNTHHRGKIEVHDNYVFVVTKNAELEPDGQVHIQHFCLILTNEAVLTFGEAPTGIFNPLLRRIRGGQGRIRKMKTDYLAWALLDAVVDHYFVVIDEVEGQLSNLEELLQENITAVDALQLYTSKSEITSLHKLVRPLRAISNGLQLGGSPLLTEATHLFFRDLHDHSLHLAENAEELRELASNLRDFYLTAVSNRMNEVMKVLTCVATLFLPLSFLAGVYGMNFEHMPELGLPWAYPAIWLCFLSIAGGMLWLFFSKKWL